ncbi:MAG: phosphate ABC transporter permease PstA, partial [Alphaproteobacteria bacterium]|nr:phosphate ABC transporter permease PstA [Alphaproteobacteria bacterium]
MIDPRHRARRVAAERRFRLYGAAALVIATALLAYLLLDIVRKGYPAFYHHRAEIAVTVPAGEFEETALLKESWRALFPEATSRADRKKANSLLSASAVDEFKALLAASMPAAGTTIRFAASLSDTADLYLKGQRASGADPAMMETLASRTAITRHFAWHFLENGDSREAEVAGLRGALIGSLYAAAVAMAIGLPLGIGAALYLEQFAPKNRWSKIIEININNLAAVPSIIFGLLGLAIFINMFGLPRSTPLVGGMVLSLLVLPTIIIATRAALRSVPPSIREAALGIGASEQQAVFHHVLPVALPGILTGTILALARAFGETAPLLMIGMVAFIADVPSRLTDAAAVLPVQIYLWSDLPELTYQSKTAGAIIVLIVVLFLLNGAAIYLRKCYE